MSLLAAVVAASADCADRVASQVVVPPGVAADGAPQQGATTTRVRPERPGN